MQPQQPSNSQPDQPQPSTSNQAGQVFNPSATPPAGSDSTNASPAPAEPSPLVSASSAQEQTSPKPPRRFKPSKKFAAILAIVVVLLGGSAAAYFGYVVPNNPDNILKQGVENTLMSPHMTIDGTANITSKDLSAKLTFKGVVDSANHRLDAQTETTVSGVKIPLELLTDDGNLYFKVGDLSSVSSLAGMVDPTYKSLVDKVSTSISNQWVIVDSTLINEAKMGCLMQYPTALNQQDIQALENSYKKGSFVKVVNHASDTVNGASAYKYQIEIDDNSSANFNVSSAPTFKKLDDCLNSMGGDNVRSTAKDLKDNDKTPLTLWVDKKTKRIVKIANQSTAQDKSKGVTGDVSATVSYGSINIQKPTNAKPVLQLLSDIGLGNLMDQSGIQATTNPGSSKDTERRTDLNALTGMLEVYYTDNGSYPTLANLSNPSWRKANLQGNAENAFKDPDGKSDMLVAAPKANAYAYQPGACDQTGCQSYSLTATLSDGTKYVKKSLN